MRILLLCCMILATDGLAQTVAKDPTRPPKYKSPAALAAEANTDDNADAGAIIEEQVVEGVTFPRAKLSAIFYSDIMRYAILNNEIVNEGDSWNNAVLARVLPDRIVLQRENKQREIMLNETKIIIEKSYDN